MANRIDPETPIYEGEVIVRVGGDSLPCPKGPGQYIFPVVQLIWPSTEQSPNPKGNLTIRWQDKLDATKPSKSPNPKFIGLMTDEGQQWVGYRVSDTDRALFEMLRKKWGMWFMRVRRQGDSEDFYITFFNDGGWHGGSVITRMDEYVQAVDARELQKMLLESWQDTVRMVMEKAPHLLPKNEDDLHNRAIALSKIPALLEELGGGPLPWKLKELPHWGKPDNKSHDAIVQMYLLILKALRQNADNKKLSEKFQHECAKMWDLLRGAKIFEIAPESYVELHMQVDRYVTEEIAQLPFYDPRDAKVDVPPGESELLYRRQTEALQVLPFPEKFPFDVCWFAISGGLAISDFQAETRQLAQSQGPYQLAGILTDEVGEHHELLISRKARRNGDIIEMNLHITTHRVEEESTWQHPFCLAPFVLHALVDGVNDHQTTIVAQRKLSLHSQGKIKKGLGDLGLKRPIPPPFYTVYLRDKVIKEVVKGWGGGKLRAKYAHRFDVRGHYCFKIYRGQMPMDAEMELHLDKLRYDIFKTKPLDEATIDALQERGQPPRQENEWIAIKRFWKKSYVKGPENGPYVPSTRKATKGVLSIDNGDYSDQNSSSNVA
jgi:hypothetical protein